MKFKSPHLKYAITGDARRPKEVADDNGITAPSGYPHGADQRQRYEKPLIFDTTVGALRYPDEGVILICRKLEDDI